MNFSCIADENGNSMQPLWKTVVSYKIKHACKPIVVASI